MSDDEKTGGPPATHGDHALRGDTPASDRPDGEAVTQAASSPRPAAPADLSAAPTDPSAAAQAGPPSLAQADPQPPAQADPQPAAPAHRSLAAPAGTSSAGDESIDPGAPLAADGPTVRLTPPPPAAGRPGPAAWPPRSGSAADPRTSSGPAEPAVGDGDEPTEVWTAATGDDEATTLLTPPAPASSSATPSGDDEPTLRTRLDGGETVRLQPPFFAPRTSTIPRSPSAAAAPGTPSDETPVPDLGERQTEFGSGDGAEREEPAGYVNAQPGPAVDGPDREEPAGYAAARTRPEPVGQPAPAIGGAGSGERDDPGAPLSVPGEDAAAESPVPVTATDPAAQAPSREREKERKITSAGALIWVLLALLGFTLVVQLRSNDADAGLATARQEDLVGILSDLEARDQRLQQEINTLEESQRQLTSGVAGRQAALAEAGKRADELGLLSGTLAAHGPGLHISIDPRGQPIKASQILNAVQELRGAGGEVMEIVGANGVAVRIVASSYFVDAAGGQVIVDGKQLSGPYTLRVIGVPSTMQTALQIPGGVVASVSQAGGNVTMEQRSTVEVTAVRQPTSLQYARPVK